MFGPPGAGKGTQSHLIAEALGLPRLATGEMFRDHLQKNTELGELARMFLQRGELVPDEVTIAMVQENLARESYTAGALFDGFPRTLSQVEALDRLAEALLASIQVASIVVPDDLLVDRLSGRTTCRAEGHTFHQKFNPPQQAGVCDFDGSELYQRADDRAETVRNRIRVYHHQTAPVLTHYQRQGHLVEVDGTVPIERVTEALLEGLKGVRNDA